MNNETHSRYKTFEKLSVQLTILIVKECVFEQTGQVKLSRKVYTLQGKENTSCTFLRQVFPPRLQSRGDSYKYLIILPGLKDILTKVTAFTELAQKLF